MPSAGTFDTTLIEPAVRADVTSRRDLGIKAMVYGALSVACMTGVVAKTVDQLVLAPAVPTPAEEPAEDAIDACSPRTAIIGRSEFDAWGARLIARRAGRGTQDGE